MKNNINCLYKIGIKKLSIIKTLLFFITILATTFNAAAFETKKTQAKEELKVITLAPHITELVYAAGAGHTIIGTVRSSNFPKQAKQIYRIGDGLNVNVEHLLTLKPDLVYAWQDNFANKKISEKLSPFGIEVLFSNPTNINEIITEILSMGEKLNTLAEAQAYADELEKDIKRLQQTYSHKEKLKIFIEIGAKPIYTLGKDPLTNSALDVCGAVNIFSESLAVAPTISPEQVMKLNPDIIIVTDTNVSNFAKRIRFWEKLKVKAALNHNIYTIDPDQLLRPGPRIIEAAEKICELVDGARISNTKKHNSYYN